MGSLLSQHEGLEVQLAIRRILLGIRAATHAKVQNGVKAHFLNIFYSFVSSVAYSGVNLTDLLSAVEQILQEGATPSVTPAPILLGWAHDGCAGRHILRLPFVSSAIIRSCSQEISTQT